MYPYSKNIYIKEETTEKTKNEKLRKREKNDDIMIKQIENNL